MKLIGICLLGFYCAAANAKTQKLHGPHKTNPTGLSMTNQKLARTAAAKTGLKRTAATEKFLLPFDTFKRLPYEKKLRYVHFLSRLSSILEQYRNDPKIVTDEDLKTTALDSHYPQFEAFFRLALENAEAEDGGSAPLKLPGNYPPPAPPETSSPSEENKDNSEPFTSDERRHSVPASTKKDIIIPGNYPPKESNTAEGPTERAQPKPTENHFKFMDQAKTPSNNSSNSSQVQTQETRAPVVEPSATNSTQEAPPLSAGAKKRYERKVGATCMFGNRHSRYVENKNPDGPNPVCRAPKGSVNQKVCRGTEKPNFLCPSFGLTKGQGTSNGGKDFCIPLYGQNGLKDLSVRCSEATRNLRVKLQANRVEYERSHNEIKGEINAFKNSDSKDENSLSLSDYCADDNLLNEKRQLEECGALMTEVKNMENDLSTAATPPIDSNTPANTSQPAAQPPPAPPLPEPPRTPPSIDPRGTDGTPQEPPTPPAPTSDGQWI